MVNIDERFIKEQAKVIYDLQRALEILHPRPGQWVTPNDQQAKQIEKAIEAAETL